MRIHALLMFCFLILSFSSNAASDDLNLLRELVMISSKTEDVEGVNRVQDRKARELKALGFTIEMIDNPGVDPQTGKPYVSGKLLVATLAGSSSGFITLVGHADTVFKTLNPFTLSADGKTARGSGVGDAKGGFVVGLAAIRELLKSGRPQHSIRLISTPSEETGSNGFKELLAAYSKDSIAVLGIEPTMPGGEFVTQRKGLRWYKITVTGRKVHSGVEPQKGINACYELFKKLSMAQELTDPKAGISVSIGMVSGGAPSANAVCPEATGTLDSRFWTVEQGRKLETQIRRILDLKIASGLEEDGVTRKWAETKFEITNLLPPFAPDLSRMKAYIDSYKKSVAKYEGRPAQNIKSGGGADLNLMNRPGLLGFDGLGPVTRGSHQDSEEIDVSSLRTRAMALSELLMAVDRS